jgi:uncharacterized repeat protein (TIGR01451 family)
MKNTAIQAILVALGMLACIPGFAVGTAAGTLIESYAEITYSVSAASELKQQSNAVQMVVAELLNVSVSWQDAAEVPTHPGDSLTMLTFLITNIGNGAEPYILGLENRLADDDFDPTFAKLYLDANGDGRFDAAEDTPYVLGSPTAELPPDSSLGVFVFNATPTEVTDSQLGRTRLTARSGTGSGKPGLTLEGLGDDGTDAVVGATGATSGAYGVTTVWDCQLKAVKAVEVVDPFGGSQGYPGATLTYKVTISVEGTGTLEDAVFTDPIPENTSYCPNSLKLDDTTLSDEADNDVGELEDSSPAQLSVQLGTLSKETPPRTISFQVTIK